MHRTWIMAITSATVLVGATAAAWAQPGHEQLLSPAERLPPLFTAVQTAEQLKAGHRFPEMARKPGEAIGQYRQRFHWVSGPDPASVGQSATNVTSLEGGGLCVTTTCGRQFARTETYPLSCGGFVGACEAGYAEKPPSPRQSLFAAPSSRCGFFYLDAKGKPQAIGIDGAITLAARDLSLGALGLAATSAVAGAARVAEHFGARRAAPLEAKARHMASLLQQNEARWPQGVVRTWNAVIDRVGSNKQPPEQIQIGPVTGSTICTVTPGPGKNVWIRRQWDPYAAQDRYRLLSTELFQGNRQLAIWTNAAAPVLNRPR